MKKLFLIIILLLVAATPLLATTIQGTCGDNICRTDTGEDKQTCPQDCGKLPSSELVFQYVTFRPVSVVSNGTDHIEARIEFYFYYYNTTKLVYGTQSDATQFIADANCTYELNENIFQTQHDILDIQYFVQLNVVNDGQYNGLIRCTSSLGNKMWPVPFKIENGRYYSQIISPEEIATKLTINEINNSGYKNFVNLTQIVQEQKQKEQNKFPSFTNTISNIMGLALLVIALLAYTVLSVLYAISRTIQYMLNIGKGAKLPIAAIAILLTCVLAIAFLPLLILVPVVMTLKIIHWTIRKIIPKKNNPKSKQVKIEQI